MHKAFHVFKETIEFFKEQSFDIFDFGRLEDFYSHFKNEIKEEYKENLEEYIKEDIQLTIFLYLGFDTKYMGYDYEVDCCTQIWNYFLYLEDYHNIGDGTGTAMFKMICNKLNKMSSSKIKVSEIIYTQVSDWYHKISFNFGEKNYHLESEYLSLLGDKFIWEIVENEQYDYQKGNFFIFNEDPVKLIFCTNKQLEQILNFLDYRKSLGKSKYFR